MHTALDRNLNRTSGAGPALVQISAFLGRRQVRYPNAELVTPISSLSEAIANFSSQLSF
jgi:hypothetical protein